ncbi:MAG: DEAD/DEAH box helicase family protein [Elusimicrobia bacterium]|nr:DEAD/DEAH box helicase family protein [Elusimicrobiota bacterium]
MPIKTGTGGWEIINGTTPGGIPMTTRILPPPAGEPSADPAGLRLRLEFARLQLLRGFEELLCLEGLRGVEQLPHQVETVRKVLRHFRGRALLADEVGLGKTIEACLLLREYLLRALVKRVLILVPAPLTGQWREELSAKFSLEFSVPGAAAGAEFWSENNLVLASISLAKGRRHFRSVTATPWDLVIVDEAHHCKNRATLNWQLVNALRRRYLFLLTATPVQNDLLELYNLLTLLEPGHLKTEKDFKKTYIRRGSPRDPLNRDNLRSLLGEVMVRNTRSLVNIRLPRRYAQTFVLQPDADEALLYSGLDSWLRDRCSALKPAAEKDHPETGAGENSVRLRRTPESAENDDSSFTAAPAGSGEAVPGSAGLARMQLNSLLLAAGSHPAALAAALERIASSGKQAPPLMELARRAAPSAKERKLLELLTRNPEGKTLVFANFRATLARLGGTLAAAGIRFSVFSGSCTTREKEQAVEEFRSDVPVMLCSESGGEGHNLQFANTLVNFDLPWNPMRIEQRVGRLHRIGQTREVFIFNLCTAGSMEERILRILDDKIHMFELVVGEVGSILGNLEGGEEFESLVFNLWLRTKDKAGLDSEFDRLGESLVKAQEEYVKSRELDEALFGEDYE